MKRITSFKALSITTPKAIGILLMVFSFIAMVIATPLINYIKTSGEVTVVVATQDLNENTVITDTMVKEIKVPKSEIVSQFAISLTEIIGKYASTVILANEPLSKNRISATPTFKDYFLYELPEGKQAISVSLANMAASVSGKIQPNDIVTIYACPQSNESSSMAVQPKELKYVKVLDVVTTEGASLADGSEAAASQLSTVTLLVDTAQASMLAYYDRVSPVHLALAFRGDSIQADKLLQEQESSLLKIINDKESEDIE